jgi:hypothetical protein
MKRLGTSSYLRVILAMLMITVWTFVMARGGEQEPRSFDGHCDRCGSCRCIRKVAVPKPVEREEKKVCWDAKCEDVVIPGPSCLCGQRHGRDACGCFWYQLWKPTWAEVITKTVPVRREVTRKVPGAEWIIEERCCHCR